MNSGSQNFPHHFGALRERLLHPTDYELAVNYFLEEFADDVAFLRGSEPEQMRHLLAALNIVVSKAIGVIFRQQRRACEGAPPQAGIRPLMCVSTNRVHLVS